MGKYRIVEIDERDTRVKAAREAEERLFERYGVKAAEHVVDVKGMGVKVRVSEMGQGPAVLAVPGNIGDAFPLIPLAALLPAYRILLLNRPGGGLSGGFDHTAADFRDLADCTLLSVLDHFGLERAHLLAHSIGAHWGLWFAMGHPRRTGKMILMGSPGNVMECGPPFILRLASLPGAGRAAYALTESSRPEKAIRSLNFLGHSRKTTDALPPEMGACWHAFSKLPNRMASSLSMMRATGSLSGSSKKIRITKDGLGDIAVPAMMIWGGRDTFASVSKGRAVADALPDCEFKIVKDGGHLPWLDDPNLCAEWIRGFLSDGEGDLNGIV